MFIIHYNKYFGSAILLSNLYIFERSFCFTLFNNCSDTLLHNFLNSYLMLLQLCIQTYGISYVGYLIVHTQRICINSNVLQRRLTTQTDAGSFVFDEQSER